MNQSGLPDVGDFQGGRVTNNGQSEIIRQRLYDWQLYPTAGVNQLSFFQVPVGGGLTTAVGAAVGQPKNYWDTNMVLGGQLPSGMSYLVESIELFFMPGAVATANTYTAASPNNFAAASAAALQSQLQDVNTFYQAGLIEFNILQKNYLRETPALAFPPKTYFDGVMATSQAGVTGATSLITLHAAGRPMYTEYAITLQPAINFELIVKYPALVATPSGFNGRVGWILDGWMLRASQ